MARLVCFPHSGGSANEYHSWLGMVPPHMELVTVQYPGRAERFEEIPVTDVRAMASHIASELTRLEPAGLALFGHSLGALVAYETAASLQALDSVPIHLFVSGSLAPGEAGGGLAHLMSDAALWSSVCALGTVDPSLREDREFRDLVLPALRADVTANETYRPTADAEPLTCPIRCYFSPEDPLVAHDRLGAWATHTVSGLTLRARPGSHFHVRVDPDGLVADIVHTLTVRDGRG
ncbi:thioesterase II family protein [Streptomyces sp. NPDC057654]|uniref:thioesterase II family protein n=1 Tax=Streptomyces sp. NPDC057654 TaxID=3346196 RepID=UPI00369901A2